MGNRSDSSTWRTGIAFVAAGLLALALLPGAGAAVGADEPEEAEGAAAQWSVRFLAKPVVLSTVNDTEIRVTVHNPKSVEKTAVLPLTFKKGQKVVLKWGVTTLPVQHGDTPAYITVPSEVVQTAKEKKADRVVVKLVVAGIPRATDTAVIDYDLRADPVAEPTSGTGPLEVHFSGHAQGGKEPWSFAWDFGDGQVSTAQNPVHTYAAAGSYTATLTVTDAMGGTAKGVAGIFVY